MKQLLKSLAPGLARWASSRRYYWRSYWSIGEWELRELARYVDRGRRAIDVGGNNGTYAYHLSRLARGVTVFEPNPHYADYIRTLGFRDVSVEPVALSREPGRTELRIPRDADGGEQLGMATVEAGVVGADRLSRVVPVELRTLDSYGFADIGFIKIDVEGHEEAALDGAMATIAASRPSLLIEIEERHNAGGLERIAARLGTLGYDGYYFEDRVRKPLSDFDAARDQMVDEALDYAGHDRRALAYINNFLFVPRAAS